jgi:hypothetical protein
MLIQFLGRAKFEARSICFFCCLFSLVQLSARSLQHGEVEGILTQKGVSWIEVKDDLGYANRYLPHWDGDAPSKGGGFNNLMLQTIEKLVVGNRVWLKWSHDEHLRIDKIKVLEPMLKEGEFKGYVLEVGDRWIDVQNKQEGIPWRFYLPWKGGYPWNGGGYDQKIRNRFINRLPTEPIFFEWKYLSRPVIVRLFGTSDTEFRPFYEGKEYRERTLEEISRNRAQLEEQKKSPNLILFEKANKLPENLELENEKPSNPFEQASGLPGRGGSANPFEMGGAGGLPGGGEKPSNPFEQASGLPGRGGSANPFEMGEAGGLPGGGEKPSNPFEQSSGQPVRGGSVNPFEMGGAGGLPSGGEKPSNPFEQSSGQPVRGGLANPFEMGGESSDKSGKTQGENKERNPFNDLK